MPSYCLWEWDPLSGRIGDFFGDPVRKAERPPENLFERPQGASSLFRQQSEALSGSKKDPEPRGRGPFPAPKNKKAAGISHGFIGSSTWEGSPCPRLVSERAKVGRLLRSATTNPSCRQYVLHSSCQPFPIRLIIFVAQPRKGCQASPEDRDQGLARRPRWRRYQRFGKRR